MANNVAGFLLDWSNHKDKEIKDYSALLSYFQSTKAEKEEPNLSYIASQKEAKEKIDLIKLIEDNSSSGSKSNLSKVAKNKVVKKK